MTLITNLVTFATNAVQLPAAPNPGLVARVYVEPLRSNTAVAFIGDATVTKDGSGTGVIREIAAVGTAATAVLDSFDIEDQSSGDRIDPTQFWVHGTSGQKVKVTYWQE